MTARSSNMELDLQLAGVLEELLLHARALDDPDWQKARVLVEQDLGAAKVPTQTELSVILNDSATWRDRWAKGDQLTGVPEIDEILSGYDIQVQTGSLSALGYYALVVPREVNGSALENRLASLSRGFGLIPGWDPYTWGNSLQLGSGTYVRPQPQVGGWSLAFYIGWGDCAAGCISGRLYSFVIESDGNTRLREVSGDPLP